jgi:hypothetical protein
MLKVPVAALAPKGDSFEPEIETFLLGGPTDGSLRLLSESSGEPVLGDNPAGQAKALFDLCAGVGVHGASSVARLSRDSLLSPEHGSEVVTSC